MADFWVFHSTGLQFDDYTASSRSLTAANWGNRTTRTTTRRRHAASQFLMLQSPHRSQPRAPHCIQDRRRVNCFALTPTSGRAGRQISRTGRRTMATMKPTTPLLTPNKGPMKPASPLRPTTAPKTSISHPQRRWRFQSHIGASEQRRRWFQTTGPPGRQGQAAAPVGPEAMSGPAISHLVLLTRTLTRQRARGQRRPDAC